MWQARSLSLPNMLCEGGVRVKMMLQDDDDDDDDDYDDYDDYAGASVQVIHDQVLAVAAE